eukprot:scaffold9364_cov216-Amphora_coffeaeformis.AAC.6
MSKDNSSDMLILAIKKSARPRLPRIRATRHSGHPNPHHLSFGQSLPGVLPRDRRPPFRGVVGPECPVLVA